VTAPVRNGLLVALVHVLLVASLGGKLMFDRATRPRVWARVAPIDPDLPIRGRYVQMRIEAAPDPGLQPGRAYVDVALAVENGRLVARPASASSSHHAQITERDGRRVVVLRRPLAYFIPEDVADPSRRPPGEELWAEVTLPRRGPPRPIRLGVGKRGIVTPLNLR
jgi:hypothetical protein